MVALGRSRRYVRKALWGPFICGRTGRAIPMHGTCLPLEPLRPAFVDQPTDCMKMPQQS